MPSRLENSPQPVSKRTPAPSLGRATARHTTLGSAHRPAAETFISNVFRSSYGATLTHFAPNLMLLEKDSEIIATVGWRPASAGTDRLFLENYLDAPIETKLSLLTGKSVPRNRIVEVGNLAATGSGSGVKAMLTLAAHLDLLGFEWVVFTATSDLLSIFHRLGLPPLELAPADPVKLGIDADSWGSYYATNPIVVAGQIRMALEHQRTL